nr:hypothetical protein [Eubacterium sp.]
MKQIKVNDKCTGCGLCTVESTYLKENAEGDAEAIPGVSIKESDMKMVQKIVAGCPENALEIVETGNAVSKGKAGVREIIEALKQQCDSFRVTKVCNSDIKLKAEDYYISTPYSVKDYVQKYSSENAAKSAAREEFNRLCYSESAYRPILKKIFVEYKLNILKPYYTSTNEENSFFYPYNQKMKEVLANTYAELLDVLGEECKLPQSWKDFSISVQESEVAELTVSVLKNFEERSTNSGIIHELKNISGINDYLSDIDVDYDEEYIGEGRFGKSKYKKVWYFTGFNTAAKSYIDDLKWAINYMSSDIEEGAVKLVNCIIEQYESEVKAKLNQKIAELEQCDKEEVSSEKNVTKSPEVPREKDIEVDLMEMQEEQLDEMPQEQIASRPNISQLDSLLSHIERENSKKLYENVKLKIENLNYDAEADVQTKKNLVQDNLLAGRVVGVANEYISKL